MRLPIVSRGVTHEIQIDDEDLGIYESRPWWSLNNLKRNKHYVAHKYTDKTGAHTVYLHRLITRATITDRIRFRTLDTLDLRKSNLIKTPVQNHNPSPNTEKCKRDSEHRYPPTFVACPFCEGLKQVAAQPVERFTAEALDSVVRAQQGRCLRCRLPLPKHRSRLALCYRVPLAVGGTHTIDNVFFLCQDCNEDFLSDDERVRVAS